jgi:hypothetical protein
MAFVRGRSTSGHRRSMATFDCRVDVNDEELPFALLRGEAGENFATRASLLM